MNMFETDWGVVNKVVVLIGHKSITLMWLFLVWGNFIIIVGLNITKSSKWSKYLNWSMDKNASQWVKLTHLTYFPSALENLCVYRCVGILMHKYFERWVCSKSFCFVVFLFGSGRFKWTELLLLKLCWRSVCVTNKLDLNIFLRLMIIFKSKFYQL